MHNLFFPCTKLPYGDLTYAVNLDIYYLYRSCNVAIIKVFCTGYLLTTFLRKNKYIARTKRNPALWHF